ncbi:MAG: helix-turn-helix domain-containing protein [Myxococcota bacterium]
MKPLPVQSYYEVLEVSRDANGDQIERAYRMARMTYGNDSLAGYSVFAEGDAVAILERVEAAYRVLSNGEARRAYDVSLAGPDAPRAAPVPLAASAERERPRDPLEGLEEEGGDFDGSRLRRARLRRGLDLEEVADKTKISSTFLRCLEEERFADLPARVYVRGFVAAYASCLGLDSGRAASAYMRRYECALGGDGGASLYDSLG